MFDLQALCLVVVLMPLGAALTVGLLGKQIGRKGAHRVTITAVGLSFLLSLIILKYLYWDDGDPLNFNLYIWAKTSYFNFQIGFLIDRLTILMMLVVTFVSWMVHIYTIGYMQDDPGYQRFFSYIACFTFGMLMLVMSNNFLQLFFGWEMVGLMSYLLIGFWFKKETAVLANLKAFIVNRIGDFGFVLGIAAVLQSFGSLEYQTIFKTVRFVAEQGTAIDFICLALFMGAMGKSAQIPLHVWLPDSMEGPTPISALIHAATMVTAGVFMLARLSPLFEYSEIALNVILVIGALTCVLMGLVGVVQNDIKRISAYSTLSQLGYMMTAMGVSAYPIGIFHLTTHAFFKALLFLGAGSVIIAMHHEQDIWKMGNLKKYMPVTYGTMLIGSLALSGFPFFSGFYSKDLIIEAVHVSILPGAAFAYPIVLGSVYVTALYTFRSFFVVFHTKERMSQTILQQLRESPAVMILPLVLLAIPACSAGALLVKPLFQDFFQGSITILPQHTAFKSLQAKFTGAWAMGMHGFYSPSVWLCIAGIASAWLAYVQMPNIPNVLQKKFGLFDQLLRAKFGFDLFNQQVLAAGVRQLGSVCWYGGDQWLIDGVGVNGSANTISRMAYFMRKFQRGYLYQYAFIMILGFLVLLAWIIL